jgi:hypothetical protein
VVLEEGGQGRGGGRVFSIQCSVDRRGGGRRQSVS